MLLYIAEAAPVSTVAFRFVRTSLLSTTSAASDIHFGVVIEHQVTRTQRVGRILVLSILWPLTLTKRTITGKQMQPKGYTQARSSITGTRWALLVNKISIIFNLMMLCLDITNNGPKSSFFYLALVHVPSLCPSCLDHCLINSIFTKSFLHILHRHTT